MAERVIFSDLGEHDEMFLSELSGRIEVLAGDHAGSEKEYDPYEFVDEMDQAIADGTLNLDDPGAQLDEATKAALIVNLITEEGIPEYTSTIQRRLPFNHPLRHWSHLWTADEGRHGPTIANILHRTKQFSMRELERMRMAMMRYPDTPQPASVIESVVYPGIQEPATEISHRNTMRRFPRALVIARRAIGRVTHDEVRHGGFYAGVAEAAMEVNPSVVVIAAGRQVRDFAMPGKSMPGFEERARIIREADIFGPRQLRQIYDDFLVNRLGIFRAEGLSPEAEKARDFIAKRLKLLDRLSRTAG